jgi:hypothetical protein
MARVTQGPELELVSSAVDSLHRYLQLCSLNRAQADPAGLETTLHLGATLHDVGAILPAMLQNAATDADLAEKLRQYRECLEQLRESMERTLANASETCELLDCQRKHVQAAQAWRNVLSLCN